MAVADFAFKYVDNNQDNLLKFRPSIRKVKKGDLNDFECDMVVGVRRPGLSISESADPPECSCITIPRVWREKRSKQKKKR